MKIKGFLLIGVLALMVSFAWSGKVEANPPSQSMSWATFIKQVREQAISQGIRPQVFDEAFQNVKAPNRRVMGLYRNQPEKRLTFVKYRNTRADAFRIRLGRSEMKKHLALLTKIGGEYGVSPCFITSLWGLETSYGRFMGGFYVIKSLATLAYDNPRYAFFRKQLLHALHILNDRHVSIKDFKGEWAGASGQPQFLPSSWHNFAVDYDKDGRKDIWKTLPDVFASIANYLIKHGWKSGQPWSIHVRLPARFDQALLTREVVKSVADWRAMGVHPAPGYVFPAKNLPASVVHPYGGPTLMVFNNFNVIMKWNRSIYYAGTVGYMAEKICRKKL